ncbi:MAG: YqeG family HAD IIIA-type phosphatase [Peptococcaceae bacterium]|nr:YqeG family HAD IIIA-type phosphatase [Peptococcaceae bacterium]
MLGLLYPKMYVPSVTHIDPDGLYARGIRCVLFDLDNTVVPRDKYDLPPEVAGWINRLKEKGIKVCVVSNNGPERIRRVAGMEGIPSVCRAVKPFKHPFRKAMKMLGVTAGETAVVGDQIFTDILGGNRLGLYTILVAPMPGKEYWATEMFNRRLEKLVLNRIRRKTTLGGLP